MTMPIVDEVPRGLPALVKAATAVALLAATVGTLATGRVSSMAGGVAVAVVIAMPLLRVALLAARWARLGDRRYALAACCLLLVTATGAALALL